MVAKPFRQSQGAGVVVVVIVNAHVKRGGGRRRMRERYESWGREKAESVVAIKYPTIQQKYLQFHRPFYPPWVQSHQ